MINFFLAGTKRSGYNIVLKSHFEFVFIKFLRSYVARYCAKFQFQTEKARVEILNTRLGIYI